MALLDEITEIFKREKGFDRLFSLFIKKYNSYERVEKGISVVLNNPTKEEKQALSGFTGTDYSRNKSIKITAKKMEKAILKTKYGKALEGITFQQILECYHGKSLISNREASEIFLKERDSYFEAFKQDTESELFLKLLDWIKSTKYNRFYQLYQQDKAALTLALNHLKKAFCILPLENDEYLAMFAANVTGNPHAFDANENEGRLFIYALQIVYALENDWEIRDLNAEERAQILYHFKIMTDDLLNFVSVYHVTGVNQDGKENQLLLGATKEKAFFHVPLREVVKLEYVQSASGKNRLFVIENSSVASHVVNELLKCGIEETIVSSNGQFKIATLKFLDAFVESGGIVYYSGDYDPEGILMAYKLKRRYGNQLVYWNYDVDTYLMSHPREQISEKRLKQFHLIEGTELQSLIQEIKERKKTGYQENTLAHMIEDIRRFNQE